MFWFQFCVINFLKSISIGLSELVVYLLNEGVPVDLKVQINEKPQSIHLAALEGRLKIIDILIK